MEFEFLDLNYNPVKDGEDPDRFGFTCPKNQKNWCTGLLIRKDESGPRPSWTWNGDKEKPTFQPSIDCKNCSHGYITDGQWKDAG